MHYMYKFVHTIVDNMRSICVLYEARTSAVATGMHTPNFHDVIIAGTD